MPPKLAMAALFESSSDEEDRTNVGHKIQHNKSENGAMSNKGRGTGQLARSSVDNSAVPQSTCQNRQHDQSARVQVGGQRADYHKSRDGRNMFKPTQSETVQYKELDGDMSGQKTGGSGLLFTLVTEDDVLLLLGLERRTEHGFLLHFPGGRINKFTNAQIGMKADQDPLHAAWREANEETSFPNQTHSNPSKAGIFSHYGMSLANQPIKNTVYIQPAPYPDGGVRGKFALYVIEHGWNKMLPKADSMSSPPSLRLFQQGTQSSFHLLYSNPAQIHPVGVCNVDIEETKPRERYNGSMKMGLPGGKISIKAFPFPQHPISYGIDEQTFTHQLKLSYLNLPLLYDYYCHRGKEVHPYPCPGILSASQTKSKQGFEVIPEWHLHYLQPANTTDLSLPPAKGQTWQEVRHRYSEFIPSHDCLAGLHWVSLRRLAERFKRKSDHQFNEEVKKVAASEHAFTSEHSLTSEPKNWSSKCHFHHWPYMYSYEQHPNQSVWDSYFNQIFYPNMISGQSQHADIELEYIKNESALNLSRHTDPPSSCVHTPSKSEVPDIWTPQLFIVDTISGFELPLSPLVTRCLISPWGIFSIYEKELKQFDENDRKKKEEDEKSDQMDSEAPALVPQS